MKKLTKVTLVGILLAAATLPTSGCDKVKDAQGAVCCSADEFQVGGSVSADIGGGAEGQIAAQAVADFAGIAAAAVSDITGACRSIAQDLDAAKADQDAAEAKTGRDKMNAWCVAAVTAVTAFKAQAGGTLTITVDPPKCEASISAKANCQAKCSGSASCDLKANPPTCTGGKLEVSCKGGCTAEVGATVGCEGSCEGECDGSCVAEGGVECTGKCDGTCEASATSGGTGIQANGTCQGVCKGTCEVTPPTATCTGSCKGQCKGTCKATATASVKCDGKCDADYEPLKCTGGKLEGGCKAEAKCDANCDASVQAKAVCHPPKAVVKFSGAANVEAAGKLQATFAANLGVIFALEARLKGMVDIGGTISGNVSAFGEIKPPCLLAMIFAIDEAVKDVGGSVSASGSIVATTK